ncbi:hypothetical protein Tco_0655044 [Tanacetum coccineum]|uniref:Reverse transcriptase domain-containing protein n=1 Tax=Tanacetum coccineum TaxID=301880 RepID=A0ABQ4X5J7_9ASTR
MRNVTFHVSNLKKCLTDANLHVPLEEIKVDKTLRFVEEHVEIMDHEVKKLKRSRIPIVKVRWNSKRGPEFIWEQEDFMRSKYPRLFANSAEENTNCLMLEDTELTKVGGSSADELVIDSNDMDFRKGLHKHARRNRDVNRVENIPVTFESEEHYFGSFFYPLLEETRCELASSMEIMYKENTLYDVTIGPWKNQIGQFLTQRPASASEGRPMSGLDPTTHASVTFTTSAKLAKPNNQNTPSTSIIDPTLSPSAITHIIIKRGDDTTCQGSHHPDTSQHHRKL